MRLLVNATAYGEPGGGAAIRARELCGALRGHEVVFLLAEDTPAWVVPQNASSLRMPGVRAGRPFGRWCRLRIPVEQGDVLLTDHYPALRSIPTILTLHDTGKSWWRRRLIRRHLRRAAAVVTVSRTVRSAWGVDATVIPNGVRPIPDRPRGRHLLFCDPGVAHKGVEIARAAADAVGRELREIGRGVRWLDREELEHELAGAAAILCPSRDEGFSMVALEAMAAGRPLVVSDLPAHREVCGDSAFYAPARDLEAWRRSTMLALEQENDPLEDSRRRARRFSWEAGARLLDLILRSLKGT